MKFTEPETRRFWDGSPHQPSSTVTSWKGRSKFELVSAQPKPLVGRLLYLHGWRPMTFEALPLISGLLTLPLPVTLKGSTSIMQVTIFCLIGRRWYWNGLWLLPDHFHLREITRSLMVAPWSRAHLIDLELWYFAYRSWALQPARLGLSYCTRFDKIS
jgi:hypothetical protein